MDGKMKHLGYFEQELQAAQVCDVAVYALKARVWRLAELVSRGGGGAAQQRSRARLPPPSPPSFLFLSIFSS